MQKQRLTLQQARNNLGYSIEQVSELTGIPVHFIRECEDNGAKAEAYHVFALLALYKIDLAHVNLEPIRTNEPLLVGGAFNE